MVYRYQKHESKSLTLMHDILENKDFLKSIKAIELAIVYYDFSNFHIIHKEGVYTKINKEQSLNQKKPFIIKIEKSNHCFKQA